MYTYNDDRLNESTLLINKIELCYFVRTLFI